MRHVDGRESATMMANALREKRRVSVILMIDLILHVYEKKDQVLKIFISLLIIQRLVSRKNDYSII